MRAVIFANGDLSHPAQDLARVRDGDLIICADGGLRHCLSLKLTPNALIGDLDSIEAEYVESLDPSHTRVIRHSPDKDATDLELALHFAVKQGAQEALILGAMGGRWDQSLANFLLPLVEGLEGLRVRWASGAQHASLLRSGESLRIQGDPGDVVSLVPLSGNAEEITTEGLRYPLEGESLLLGSTRGLSNVLLRKTADITLGQGALLCIHMRSGEDRSRRQAAHSRPE